jgi:hypothetical protein
LDKPSLFGQGYGRFWRGKISVPSPLYFDKNEIPYRAATLGWLNHNQVNFGL